MAAKVSKGSTSNKVNFGVKKSGKFSKKLTNNKKSKNYKKAYRGQGR
jgi:predicted ferric reductase